MSKLQTEIKWGVVWATAIFLLLCFEYFAGLQELPYLDWGMWVDLLGDVALPALAVGLGLRQKRDQDWEGSMSWRQGFISGLYMTLVALPLSLAYIWAFVEIVNPNYFAVLVDFSVATGQSTQDAAQAYFNLRTYLFQTALNVVAFGVVLSAVFSLLLKTK